MSVESFDPNLWKLFRVATSHSFAIISHISHINADISRSFKTPVSPKYYRQPL